MSSDYSDPFPDDDEKKELKDAETGVINSKGVACEFCKHILLETESEKKLDCGHILCQNCFDFYKSRNRKSCPICFKSVSNFK